MKTQNIRVLEHLKTGQQLTQFEAIKDLGILRLSARIWDLKCEGHKIESKNITVRNRWDEKCKVAAYSLEKS
jgi:Helix-turn-helix domain